MHPPSPQQQQRYYHIEGTEKKDGTGSAAPLGGSDLDRQGFDAKRRLATAWRRWTGRVGTYPGVSLPGSRKIYRRFTMDFIMEPIGSSWIRDEHG